MIIKLKASHDGQVKAEYSADDENYLAMKTKHDTELHKELLQGSKIQVGLLPPAIRWISADKSMIILERPPTRKVVEYVPIVRDEVTQEYVDTHAVAVEIPIPWQLYFITFSADFVPVEIRMYFRNSAMESMNDIVHLAPLLNFYYNSKLCNPIMSSYEVQESSLNAGVNAAYNLVWNSGFNYDLKDAIMLGIKHGAINSKSKRRRKLKRTSATVSDSNSTTEVPEEDVLSYNRDEIYRWLQAWSKLTVEECLDLTWPIPMTTERGQDYEAEPTISSMISRMTRDNRRSGTRNVVREFLVSIVDIINK